MNLKITDIVTKFRGDGDDIDRWFDRFLVAVNLTSSAKMNGRRKKRWLE